MLQLPRVMECGIMFHLIIITDWLTAKSEDQGLVIDLPDIDPKLKMWFPERDSSMIKSQVLEADAPICRYRYMDHQFLTSQWLPNIFHS